MKNIKSELDDPLRPEYKRSDFQELTRGKYSVSHVDFAELVDLLLTCIGEDEDLTFIHQSAEHQSGDWTYEIDNSKQVILRSWLSGNSNLEEKLCNPTYVRSAEDQAMLQAALVNGVRSLKAKADATPESS